jgi:ribosomal protein L2
MGFIASFTFIPFKNKIYSLMLFNNGSVSYYLTSNSHALFLIVYSNFFYKKFKRIKTKSIFFMLFQIKKLSFISCLELFPGKNSQYVRSPGTRGKIISFDKTNHTVLVQLPSKLKKIFSYYSFASKEAIALSMHKKAFNGKFGFWRTFGVKPLSRGVAKNPVDHPNGGRTKSLKYPKTP